jgi:NADH:ubiquinone oxidoreductase subunit C
MLILFNYIFNKRIKYNVSLFSLKLFQNLSVFLILNLKKYLNFILIKDNQIHIFINKDNIYEVCFFLKNSLYTFCNQLLDLTIVDRIEFLKDGYRWEFVYVLLSTYFNLRIFIRGYLKYYQFLSSIVELYNSSNWLEREVWDMFGIYFKNHPDLRRILTDYAFLGSPLRKDFPLTGYVETRYDDELKTIVTEPLELTQELREFRLENPWKW